MKKIGKQTGGITLISLVITIVVLLILASVTTYSGVETIKYSKFVVFQTELKIMQTQVNSLYEKWKNEEKIGEIEILELGMAISSDAQAQTAFNSSGFATEDSIADYRLYDQNTIKNVLNIEGVESNFLVNIKTRNIISYEGFEYDDVKYYTLQQIPNGLYNVSYEEE